MTQTHDQVESISNLIVISSSIARAVQDVLGGEKGGVRLEELQQPLSQQGRSLLPEPGIMPCALALFLTQVYHRPWLPDIAHMGTSVPHPQYLLAFCLTPACPSASSISIASASTAGSEPPCKASCWVAFWFRLNIYVCTFPIEFH